MKIDFDDPVDMCLISTDQKTWLEPWARAVSAESLPNPLKYVLWPLLVTLTIGGIWRGTMDTFS